MNNLVCYGTADPVVIKLIHAINRVQPTWALRGAIDVQPNSSGAKWRGLPLLDRQELQRAADEDGHMALAFNVGSHGSERSQAAERVLSLGYPVVTLIHPHVDLAMSTIGRGTIIHEGVVIGMEVRVGAFVSVGAGALLPHDVSVADCAVLESRVVLSGYTSVGRAARIQAGSMVQLHRRVGEMADVAPASVVTRDVPDGAFASGVPARVATDQRAPG